MRLGPDGAPLGGFLNLHSDPSAPYFGVITWAVSTSVPDSVGCFNGLAYLPCDTPKNLLNTYGAYLTAEDLGIKLSIGSKKITSLLQQIIRPGIGCGEGIMADTTAITRQKVAFLGPSASYTHQVCHVFFFL